MFIVIIFNYVHVCALVCLWICEFKCRSFQKGGQRRQNPSGGDGCEPDMGVGINLRSSRRTAELLSHLSSLEFCLKRGKGVLVLKL